MSFSAKIVFAYIFVLGLFFTFLVPPLQKPDEHGHFIRSILLSHGKIILTDKDVELPIEKQYYDLIHDPHLNKIPYHPKIKFDPMWYVRSPFADRGAYQLVRESTWGQFMLPASSYIPYAFGIILARFFHLNAYLTFFTGRLTMFLFVFIWTIFLFRKTPSPFKPILLFVFSLPMLIHQITGYNYDSMQYMMGFSLFVLLLNLLQKNTLSLYDLALIAFTFILFFIMKLSFEPMLLLVFLIPNKKIDTVFSRYLKKIGVVLFIILLVYFLSKSTFYLSASRYTHHPKGINPVLQTQYILSHPFDYLQNFTQSSIRLTKFHLQGAIGLFGWLDYSMDWWIYILFIVVGIYIMYTIKLDKKSRIEKWQSFLILGSIFLTYTFMMTIFYLNWKIVGSLIIDGTQGRYFLSLIPFAMFSFIQLKKRVYPLPKSSWFLLLLTFMLYLIVISVISSIHNRYY